MLESGGRTGREIELDLGIGRGLIYRWRRELGQGNIRAFPGNGNPRDEELHQLRKELADVKEDREILRKALAIFSKVKK